MITRVMYEHRCQAVLSCPHLTGSPSPDPRLPGPGQVSLLHHEYVFSRSTGPFSPRKLRVRLHFLGGGSFLHPPPLLGTHGWVYWTHMLSREPPRDGPPGTRGLAEGGSGPHCSVGVGGAPWLLRGGAAQLGAPSPTALVTSHRSSPSLGN